MGNNFVNKVWKILGVENDDEYDVDEFDSMDAPAEDREFTLNTNNNKKNKVVGMPGVQQVKVIISQPNSFEQSEEICEHLKEKKSIIVNLEFNTGSIHNV